jgi:hypothetical protein
MPLGSAFERKKHHAKYIYRMLSEALPRKYISEKLEDNITIF